MYRAVLGETLDCNIKENQLFKFFPEILTVNRLNNQNALLSFGMNINHLEKYNVKLGKLIINLDYDKIVDIISRNLKSVDFEQFYWVSKEGLVLYANEIDKKNSDYIQKVIEIIKKKGSHQFEMLDNYVVTSEEDASGWRFISITSMGDIRSRINYILYFFLLTGGVFSTIGAIGIERMIRKLMNPITKLKENMDRIKRDEFAYQPVIVETEDEFQVLADGYNNMMERIQSYIEKSVNYEKEKRKMEMNLLLAQINPHFIYNTLNTIIYLAHKGKTDIIAEVTRSFISLLQDSVKIHDSGFFSSVENELEVIRNYLDIQSKRYINKFETKFQIGEDVYQIKIIRSILQPIVENSLLHGIFRKAGKGNILISISRESERLKCIIEDDGAGMSDEDIRKIMEREYQDRSTDVYSIGLKNIRERLDLVYGPLYKLQIESEREKYTRFILEIPIESEIVS